MKSRNLSISTAAVILFILSNSALAYRPVIDLGTLGGPFSSASSINNNGQIVGQGNYRACLFDATGHGANKDLGAFNSSYSHNSWAYSINNSGQIVGMATSPDGGGYFKACLFDSTRPNNNKDLGGLSGNFSEATSINDSGKIVGMAMNTSYSTRACLFDPTGGGANKDLGTLGGGDSWAFCINNNDKIVGQASISSTSRACLFDSTGNGANTNLGILSGWSFSSASFINNANQIVGASYNVIDYQSYGHACLFNSTGSGVDIDLGTLGGAYSWANAINDNGQIVGQAYDSSGNALACLFDPTGNGNNIDLNTLIDPSCGLTLRSASGINNNGWIVCDGVDQQGYKHAILITPEPATLFLLTLGGLFLRKRKV